VTHRQPALLPNPDQTEIRVEGLRRSFDDKVVLDGIELTVRRGELVALVGGSGSGKTVLMDHLIGLLAPNSGRVLVADHDLPESPLVDLATLDDEALDRVRRHWAVVFQQNALYSMTVYENIAFWLREHTNLVEEEIHARARAALLDVGLDDVDRLLHKHRDELSGGMAKRVAVARAIAIDPIVMFYDEPTTGLDPAHAARIHELVFKEHNEKTLTGETRTTLVITHDKDLLRRLQPRIVMLTGGRKSFDGPYTQFAQSDDPEIRPYLDSMPVLHQRQPPAQRVRHGKAYP
jgi:phospholipid/cholesterol/gamma-HCH transport system ATP-binding protein